MAKHNECDGSMKSLSFCNLDDNYHDPLEVTCVNSSIVKSGILEHVEHRFYLYEKLIPMAWDEN